MKKITLPSGEYLMVEVPKDAKEFNVFNPQQPLVQYDYLQYKRNGFWDNPIRLPKGNYTLIGLCSEIGEEEAKGIVESQFDTYRNYLDTDDMDNLSCYTCDTPTESLASLVRSNGMEVDTTVLLKVN